MTDEHRVIGPPGTGKTTYVADQVGKAAVKYGASGVAIASLTKAAAKEIGSRTENLPDDNVGTIHGHAFRALGRPALAETPEGLQAWNQHIEGQGPALRIGRGAAVDPENAPPEGMATQATDGEVMLADLQRRRALLEPEDEWPPRLRRFWEAWCEWKQQTGRLDFTDLIDRAAEHAEQVTVDAGAEPDPLLEATGGDTRPRGDLSGPDEGMLAGKPAVLFVDEAQDLSRAEFRLVRAWARQCAQLVTVGDPYQNLYEWRGSSPDAFGINPVTTEIVLAQSYRVPAAVHAYAVAWAKRITNREFPEYHPTPVAGQVLASQATWARPAALIRQITADVAAGRRVMVLASCSYMLEPLCRTLREHGLPFSNPYRPLDGRWNPLRGAGRLIAFLAGDPAVDPDAAAAGLYRWWTWDELHKWVEPLRAKGLLSHGAKARIELARQTDRFGEQQPQPTAAKIATMFADDAGMARAMERDAAWWEENLRATFAKQMRYPCRILERLGPQGLTSGAAIAEPGEPGWPGLIVGTIHSAKGSQADDVYVFPDLSRQAYWSGWQNPATRDPTIRQFYVAFTRARHRLVLCDPAGGEYAHLPRPDGAPKRSAPTPQHRRLADEIRRRAVRPDAAKSEPEQAPDAGEQK